MIAPTPAQQAAAFRDGATVRYGGPTAVRLDGGYAVRDLVLARGGDPDPWLCVHAATIGGVPYVELATTVGQTMALGAQVVCGDDGGDTAIVRAALAARVPDAERHAPTADARRAEAGAIALTATNAHTRAWLLTAVDGWSAGRACGVIEETPEGLLCRAPDGVVASTLIIRCPSTGRTYAHLVPPDYATVAAARRWMLGLDDASPTPDAET